MLEATIINPHVLFFQKWESYYYQLQFLYYIEVGE